MKRNNFNPHISLINHIKFRNMEEHNNISRMQSDFEQIKKQSEDGKENCVLRWDIALTKNLAAF